MTNNLPSFWYWFFHGNGAKPGYRRVLNSWMLWHLVIGAIAASLIGKEPSNVAQVALLPLMAIFIGLTFSWAGNAHSLLQSSEIIALSKKKGGGIAEYIFVFQLSILVILVAVLCWVIPTLELPFLLGAYVELSGFNFIAKVLLYALLSLSFRTSWQAVLGANMLLLIRARLLDESAARSSTDGQK